MSRDTFLQEMIKRNIGIGVHYLSVPEHPYYQNTFGWDPDAFPHARKYGAETVSIPLSAKLSDRDSMDVVDAISDILSS